MSYPDSRVILSARGLRKEYGSADSLVRADATGSTWTWRRARR